MTTYDRNKRIPIKMTPEQAEAYRQEFLGRIKSRVLDVFKKHRELQSATLFVAQYWNDNASDEMHLAIVLSVHDEPVLPDLYEYWHYGDDPVNLPGLGTQDKLLPVDNHMWPYDGEVIPAFACYCQEGASQDNDGLSAYSKYAVMLRTADGSDVTVTVVGTKHRPWLEGVSPMWEWEGS